MKETKRIAFLSADNLEDYVIDDDLSVEPLRKLGWNAETISWSNAAIDWSQFACAIIRSTWDYQKNLPAFLAKLEEIARATQLINPLEVVRWNADKTYLRKLGERGARIVPTVWGSAPIEPREMMRWFAELDTDEVVVKPTVSANAEKTVRLAKGDLHRQAEIAAIYAGRNYMVQPFLSAIVEEGEFSLFYFGGEYSHTILKTPKAQDFRVQEEHGGAIRAAQPTAELLRTGGKIMRLLNAELLYARVDFVRDGDEFALMELELIEPSLYLRTDEDAPQRFADAIARWLTR